MIRNPKKMLQLEEYYLITSLTQMAKKRSQFITKIRSMSALLKPRTYQVEHVLDNDGEKIVLRLPDLYIADIKVAEGQYLESVAVVQYWINRLKLSETLAKYPEFKTFIVEKTPTWENLAVNTMITRLEQHFNEFPLVIPIQPHLQPKRQRILLESNKSL